MKFGVALPNCSFLFPWATPQGLVNLAVAAEELGFDSVWCNHHVTPRAQEKDVFSIFKEDFPFLADKKLGKNTQMVLNGVSSDTILFMH